jgi:DNA polymerase alpha subunit B
MATTKKSVTIAQPAAVESAVGSFDKSSIGGVRDESDFLSTFGVEMGGIDANALTPQVAGDDSFAGQPKTPKLAPSTGTHSLKRKENFKTPSATKTARRRPPVRAQGALVAAGDFATPAASKSASSGSTPKYATRTNSGTVEAVLNNDVMDDVASDAFLSGASQKVALAAVPLADAARGAPALETGAVRFMHTTAAEKANFLERRVLAMGKALRAAHSLPEYSALGVPSQSTVVVCGRICCECEPAAVGSGVSATEARLDAGSVLIEGSRSLSGGARVAVDLNSLPAFSLFPGQIVAIKVSVLLCTVTYYANRAHNLTQSP